MAAEPLTCVSGGVSGSRSSSSTSISSLDNRNASAHTSDRQQRHSKMLFLLENDRINQKITAHSVSCLSQQQPVPYNGNTSFGSLSPKQDNLTFTLILSRKMNCCYMGDLLTFPLGENINPSMTHECSTISVAC